MTATMTKEMMTYGVSNDAIKLNVAHNPEGYVDSVVKIEWCTTRDLRNELLAKGVVDPQLLLVLVHDFQETERYVVPLTAERWHIRFRNPGINTILAVVVWGAEDQKYTVKQALSRRHGVGNPKLSVVRCEDIVSRGLREELDKLRREKSGLDLRLSVEESKFPHQPSPPPESGSKEDAAIFRLEQEIKAKQAEITQLELARSGVDTELDLQLLNDLNQKVRAIAAQMAEVSRRLQERQGSPELTLHLEEKFSFEDSYDWHRVNRSQNTGELDVDIPRKMFAREPGRFLTYFGNRYEWPRPPIDQCQLRRRAWATFGTIWPWLVIKGIGWFFAGLMHAVLIGGLLLMGVRDINFGALRRPLKTHPRDLAPRRRDRSSIWWTKRNEDGQMVDRHGPLTIINPLTVTVSTVVGWLAWLFSGNIVWLYVGLGLMFGLTALMYLCFFASGPFGYVRKHIVAAWKKRQERRRKELLETIQNELASLSCDVAAQPKKGLAAALPRERRVAYVMHNVKAKVCKPFAG